MQSIAKPVGVFFLEVVPCNICCDILLLVLRAQTLVAQRPPQRAHSTPGTTQRWRWVIMVNQPPDGCPERELHETPWKIFTDRRTPREGEGHTTQTQRHTQTHKHTHAHTHTHTHAKHTNTHTEKDKKTSRRKNNTTHVLPDGPTPPQHRLSPRTKWGLHFNMRC